MREWRLAGKQQFCGGRCRGAVQEGEAFLVIDHDGTKLARCARCAKAMFGEDPPAMIEPTPVPASAPTQQPFASARGRKRFDPKLAQLAEGDQ